MTAMCNPCHPGEIIRESVEASGWTVTETAAKLGVGRQALSRLLNGRGGVSPTLALALEQIGWSYADYWMRMQSGYDLAQVRRRRSVA